jgi:hypothetical protein
LSQSIYLSVMGLEAIAVSLRVIFAFHAWFCVQSRHVRKVSRYLG